MRWRLAWPGPAATPSQDAVLADLGVPPGTAPPAHLEALVQDACGTCAALCEPRAVVQEVRIDEFATIYAGDGHNLSPAPLEDVLAGAQALALFVATVGEALSEAIARLFAENEPARAYVLDTVASLAADGLATAAAEDFRQRLRRRAPGAPAPLVVPYSPGYCGWDITGQRALFRALEPEDIGVRLGDSCLMMPLKSVSGVLVGAPAAVHEFHPAYPCCETCTTRSCEQRLAAWRSRSPDRHPAPAWPLRPCPPGER